MVAIHILLLCIGVVFAEHGMTPNAEKQCQCAVFDNDKLTSDAGLLLKQTVLIKDIDCADVSKGKEECKKMCNALALTAKKEAPKFICGVLKGHVANIKPSVFYRVCNIKEWLPSGITAEHGICCKDGAPKACEEASPGLAKAAPAKA